MTAQELKNSILQRAIEGRLVEQKAEEGIGEELYKLIQKEKKKLIKAGMLKKQKALPEIKEGEIPFEIPKTWKWVRLGELVNFKMGKTPPRTELQWWKPQVPWVSIADMQEDGLITDTKEGISSEALEKKFFNSISKKGTLLMSFKLTVGRVSILGIDAVHNEAIISIYPTVDSEDIFKSFLFKILPFITKFGETKNAIKGKTLNSASINNLLFPLPPLAEQKRIVEKLEKLMPLVERYDEIWQRLEDLDKRFPETLKKSLLQEAIKGRLVEQKAEEGAGEELYKLIQKEKKKLIKIGTLKKQKALPEIKEDEIPFEIPKTWKWVRLGEISDYSNIKRKIKPNEMDPNIWTLDLEDIEKDTGFIINRKLAFDKKIKGERVVFDKGQILFSKLRPYLKKIIVAPDSGICSSELVPFSCFGKINSEFLVYLLKSPFIDRTINLATYGVKMPRVGTETMVNLLLPLPPLAEQKRIVEKLEELMPLCEQLTRKTK